MKPKHIILGCSLFSYLKGAKHNACFKKFGKVAIDGLWIFFLAYFTSCWLPKWLFHQADIRNIQTHASRLQSSSQISSANGQPSSLICLNPSGASHVSVMYLFTAIIWVSATCFSVLNYLLLSFKLLVCSLNQLSFTCNSAFVNTFKFLWEFWDIFLESDCGLWSKLLFIYSTKKACHCFIFLRPRSCIPWRSIRGINKSQWQEISWAGC